MTGNAWMTLLPSGALVFGIIVLLVLGAFVPRHRLLWSTAAISVMVALVSLAYLWVHAPTYAGSLLAYDSRSLFFTALILVAGLVVAFISLPYWAARTVHGEDHHREYYLLFLLALAGALLLVASRHFVMLFLGIEIMSVALFGLIAYRAESLTALEAGTKYLVLSGSSSALLLLGLAFIYAATGSLAFSAAASGEMVALARGGVILAMVGFAFKLSLIPFHMWVPDVYEGAPLPVSALLAAVSKGAVAAALWQWLTLSPMGRESGLLMVLSWLAIASMVGGNLLGLWQDDLKRLLAYSSVGHMGFWLVPLAIAGPLGGEAAGYYLAAYVASVLAAFGAMAFLTGDAREDRSHVSLYRGLFWREPLAASVLAIALLSLAGIPLTVGFIAKFYVFAAGVEGARWGIVAAVAASSAIGIYYYLRVITLLFAQLEGMETARGEGKGVLLLLLLLIVLFGTLPAPFMDVVRSAMK